MPKIDKEHLEIYFERGIDFVGRNIFIADIESKQINDIIKGIYALNQLSSDPINLIVNSMGGEIYGAFAIYDCLQSIANPINTYAIGTVFSVSPLLVACGTKGHRWAAPNCSFMCHQGTVGDLSDRLESVESNIKHEKHLSITWCDLMAAHTKMSSKQWSRLCSKVNDTYFDSEQAIEYGIVDFIWQEK